MLREEERPSIKTIYDNKRNKRRSTELTLLTNQFDQYSLKLMEKFIKDMALLFLQYNIIPTNKQYGSI